jgi:multidrug efflux pump subunit AcrB
VIIESIQRNIDMGHRGKEAALMAVKDVGGGLFLAALTNIIVFLPFGVISGVLARSSLIFH